MNIYVGNISYQTTSENLAELFQAFGEVATARVITDRETGRSKGFGFVEMPNDGEAQDAIKALDGSDQGERAIKVNEARPREPRYN